MRRAKWFWVRSRQPFRGASAVVMWRDVAEQDVRQILRVFRAERHLTQGAAGRLVGISASHWSYLEAGRRKASPWLAKRLAKVTGLPFELLLQLEKPR